jgi:ferredoxin-NADP reductase
MKENTVKIKSIEFINHNVLLIATERPQNYDFKPGQATDVAINQEHWKNKKRPFTFTSLPNQKDLQFVIKVYPSHNGVTEKMSSLKLGDELIIGEVFGAIQYNGKGTFIAGGSGVTPFISIFRDLDERNIIEGNALVFANKTEKDIFLKDEFEAHLGTKYINILSEESTEKYLKGYIDKEFINNTITDFSQNFYVCGPPEMTEAVTEDLKELGVEDKQIVIEEY